MKKVRDPRFPVGIQVPVLDFERCKSHIDLLDSTHSLLPIATGCLSYKEDRPSAQELCHRLSALKQVPQYSESVQQAQERSKIVQSATADRDVKERQIGELQQQQEECNAEIQDL